jgi:hypothetical protein
MMLKKEFIDEYVLFLPAETAVTASKLPNAVTADAMNRACAPGIFNKEWKIDLY